MRGKLKKWILKIGKIEQEGLRLELACWMGLLPG